MSATKIENQQVAVELLVPFLIYKFIVGDDPSTSAYNLRLLWQKVGYLAKQVGLPLNEYQFNWYLRGPYSPAYTSILYDIDKNYEDIHLNEQAYSLNEQAISTLLPLKRLADEQPATLSLPIWFELLASIHYLGQDKKITKDQLYSKLVKYKPQFSDTNNFEFAYNHLKMENLL
ncbi:hypothetical protein [Bacillus sp. FSL K6-6540]|uniref:hypothetical protein n=1 Tax=Bacillus sp. FSL K6-6540 TaxID=2921512 RepID=UPI0030FA95C4